MFKKNYKLMSFERSYCIFRNRLENFTKIGEFLFISSNHIFKIRISTCEQDASPTKKYRVNKHATKISRLLPIIGNSSLSAVIIASEPPNYKIILILILIF